MRTSNFTADAKQIVGGFVLRAGKHFLVIKCSDVFSEDQILRVTPEDVAEFFATQANNLTSGCRTFAGLTGDWRPISELAQACLDWFKRVNVAAMRKAARQRGLIPKF